MDILGTMARRSFIKTTVAAAVTTSATAGLLSIPNACVGGGTLDERDNVIGPRGGYSPQVGTLLSMMTWMRNAIIGPLKEITVQQLDYLHDENSNSIGSMLLHLAAMERYYQIHTLEGKQWGDWSNKDKSRFDIAMNLGAEAREKIKGNNIDFYLTTLKEVREMTIKEFKNRDDKWLQSVDENWFWGPTNNYCKWFHVCEHESNHNGQIKYIKSRAPGGKDNKD
ncbi:MAG TPA: DinB family protein [Cytophagaceae bacterium]|jgi:uncharacterized damage-inducible protein DinB